MKLVSWMICPVFLLAASAPLRGQDRGAARLQALVHGLTVTPRVLIIGARPGDADADLIAWLAKGRHVETGYLSITRGESSPNFTGVETGLALSAIHTEEVLAARRIDGGEQFFTRAYDFGNARSATDAFRKWDRDTLLADLVTIIRSFRPHVIISRAALDTADHDGARQVSAVLARDVFDAALDSTRFAKGKYGLAWAPLALFEPGSGLSIDTREYDRISGVTYAGLGAESRAQLRSLGFVTPPWESSGIVELHRVASRTADTTQPKSLFDGIDTTFARLQVGALPDVARRIPMIIAAADSARDNLDVEQPARVVGYIGRVLDLVSIVRKAVPACHHPSRDIAISIGTRSRPCDPHLLDLDASIDLAQRRAADALLAAGGVSFASVADREFLAGGDTAIVTVTVFNHGDSAVMLNDVTVSGAIPVRMTEEVRVPAHGSAQVQRSVVSLAYAHPWWVWKLKDNFYPNVTTSLDGAPRAGPPLKDWTTSGIAVPENMRRPNDVTATLTVGSTTVSASVGTIVFKSADPSLGVRDRDVSGVPAVTLGFERALEWALAGKPPRNQLRMSIKSFSDKPQTFALKAKQMDGMRIDSLPSSVTLAPREWRELRVPIRGAPIAGRHEASVMGIAPVDTFASGFRTAQYSYLPPISLFRDAALRIQAVDIEIPNKLTVAYVRGVGEDGDVALKQLGIPTYPFNNEGLLRFDLDGISTVVIGSDAFRVDPGLLGQIPRLMDFARKGGTVVVMSNTQAATQPGVLPYPITFARPVVDRIMMEDAPVVAVDQRARILNWPNLIRDDDWTKWVGERASSIAATADPRYATVVEMHDPGERENRNAILVATVGKGRFIYTSLNFSQQISNGVPGAMRLLVNLMSAGLPVESRVAAGSP
jgi:LmbE family N-acetylglucosaminyl deacetylase